MAKTFEQSIAELEEIVEQLENGDVTLDESLGLFEKGIKLSKSCQKMQLRKRLQTTIETAMLKRLLSICSVTPLQRSGSLTAVTSCSLRKC